MIVSQAQIQYTSQNSHRESSSTQERVATEQLRIGQQINRTSDAQQTMITGGVTQTHALDLASATNANHRLERLIIAQLFAQITGETFHWLETEDPSKGAHSVPVELPVEPLQASSPLVYERHTRYEEVETLCFGAAGRVLTQDGREIAIDVSLTMSRSFVANTSVIIQGDQAVMTDPLVINFDGTGAQLESARFAFDLDSDGTPEQIANLRPNSGYLVLDRNGDGRVTNGSELFGPTSNNGFAELSVYDEDGNGFIDEADSVYHQLRIWQRHSDGRSSLVALGDREVGAIYLGHVSSSMQLKDSGNNSLGEVVSSGVYLREDGTSGVVQQINLAV